MAGPFVTIDTQALSPYDSDPTQPIARSFTTSLAMIPEGWYQINWLDASGHIAPTDPIQNISLEAHPYQPPLAEIGRVNMSRTRDQYGSILGIFTSATTPNNVQATGIAAKAASDLALIIGDNIPPILITDAQRVAAVKAAMAIETGLFPDQVNTGRSIYPQLKAQYEEELLRLQKQITLVGEEGETLVSDPGPTNKASWHFPHRQDRPMEDSWARW